MLRRMRTLPLVAGRARRGAAACRSRRPSASTPSPAASARAHRGPRVATTSDARGRARLHRLPVARRRARSRRLAASSSPRRPASRRLALAAARSGAPRRTRSLRPLSSLLVVAVAEAAPRAPSYDHESLRGGHLNDDPSFPFAPRGCSRRRRPAQDAPPHADTDARPRRRRAARAAPRRLRAPPLDGRRREPDVLQSRDRGHRQLPRLGRAQPRPAVSRLPGRGIRGLAPGGRGSLRPRRPLSLLQQRRRRGRGGLRHVPELPGRRRPRPASSRSSSARSTRSTCTCCPGWTSRCRSTTSSSRPDTWAGEGISVSKVIELPGDTFSEALRPGPRRHVGRPLRSRRPRAT